MEVVDLTSNDVPVKWSLEVVGQPMPMSRPRANLKRGTFFNPSTKKLMALRKIVQASGLSEPIFQAGVTVCVEMKFCMRRPNNDFKNNARGFGRLKTVTPFAQSQQPDVDNQAIVGSKRF